MSDELNCRLNYAVNNAEIYDVRVGSQETVMISMDTPLSLTVPTRNFFGRIFTSQPSIKNAKIEIVELTHPKLILSEEISLVEITKDNIAGRELEFNITANEVVFGLRLNKAAINDFNENFAEIEETDALTTVTFKLKITCGDKSKVSDEISLDLRMLPSESILNAELNIDPQPIEFSPNASEKIQVGTMVLTHTGLNESCPEFNVSLQTSALDGERRIHGVVALDIENITEVNVVLGDGDVVMQGENRSALNANKVGPNYSIRNIKANSPVHIVKIPVMFDMSIIRNPKDQVQEYNISVEGMSQSYTFRRLSQSPISCSGQLMVEKNNRLNELRVECKDFEGNKAELINGGKFSWGKRTLTPQFSHICYLDIFNSAETTDTEYEDARVVVENISQTLRAAEGRIIHVGGLNPNQYLVFKDEQEENGEMRDRYDLFPKEKEAQEYCREFTLELKSDDIREILKDVNGNFSTKLEIDIEFDYAIDLTGEGDIAEGSKKHFKGTIEWSMEQQPNPGWLSVDFGTSAIVASYDASANIGSGSLLNIHRNKEKMLGRVKSPISNFAVDDTEPEPFISSTICFNPNNEGDFDAERGDSEYNKYPVILSPTKAMMGIMLPCLKTLVGYETVPNIFTQRELVNNEFQYQVNGERYSLYTQQEGYNPIIALPPGGKGLVYVNTILSEVYKQLFKHIVCFDTGGGKAQNTNPVIAERLHKLVLSVPNTFTSKHHKILKNIAQAFFPNLRPEYLQVVSESDAVACAYLYQREKFYRSSTISSEVKTQLDEEEKVLVYDMGAGTLDLTYFIKRKNREKHEIEFKGKVGVNKAGNYLDYVIGEILVDILENYANANLEENTKATAKELRKLLGNNQQESKQEIDEEDLKIFIQNKIKPLLNSPNEEIPQFGELQFKKGETVAKISDILRFWRDFYDKNELKKLLEIDRQKRIDNFTEKRDCEALKVFIKSKIKPLLNSPNEEIPQFGDIEFRKGKNVAKISEILNSDKYKAYIAECTIDVIDSLVNLQNSNGADNIINMKTQEAQSPFNVDVVVFSGRSTSLKDIRHAVAEHITNLTNREDILCADFITQRMSLLSEAVDVNVTGNKNSLKTVVTFGSLVYADWINRPNLFEFKGKSVFANYGFIYKRPDADIYEWVPLISPNSKVQDGADAKYEESVVFNLQKAQEIRFVQSYSKDTAADWSAKHKDMISEICRYRTNPNNDGAGNTRIVTMKILRDDRVECSIKGVGVVQQEPHDDFDNESLRKSLWPVVFQKQEGNDND